MQARTAFRLAMLANGYWPLLNDCKRADRAGLAEQDRRRGRSAVMGPQRADLDRPEARRRSRGDRCRRERGGFRRRLASALDQSFPELFAHGLVRHAGGAKEAWIARVDEPFRRLASRRWYRGSDPDDPAVPKHLVECFGSLGTRQFAIDGPHARDRGRGDQHLPVCRRRLTGDDTADVAAGAAESGLRAGLRPVRRDRRGGGAHRRQGSQARPRRGHAHVLRTRRRHRDRDARLRRDDGRRAGAPPARARGARQCARNDALLGQLPRSDAGADRLATSSTGAVTASASTTP